MAFDPRLDRLILAMRRLAGSVPEGVQALGRDLGEQNFAGVPQAGLAKSDLVTREGIRRPDGGAAPHAREARRAYNT